MSDENNALRSSPVQPEVRMDARKAIDIMNAISLLADEFGEDRQDFLGSLCLFWGKRRPILNEAIRINNIFYHSDIVERGKMLGITIHTTENGYKTDAIVLSER